MRKEHFVYTIPALGRRVGVPRARVKAWKTNTAGLIIQEMIGDTNAFSLTHEASGFVLRSSINRAELDGVATKLGKLGIKWSVRDPWKLHAQVAKFDDAQIQAFCMAYHGKRPEDPAGYRETVAKMANRKTFMKWRAEQLG